MKRTLNDDVKVGNLWQQLAKGQLANSVTNLFLLPSSGHKMNLGRFNLNKTWIIVKQVWDIVTVESLELDPEY